MPPITNNWPQPGTVKDVKVVYDEPGIGMRAGKLRINTQYSPGRDLVGTSRDEDATYLTFSPGGVKRQVMELVFSGMYGLFPVGVGTDEYVIKRLWSIVLVGETQPAARLPKVFRASPTMNASWDANWRTADLTDSPYLAKTSSAMNVWLSTAKGRAEGDKNPYAGLGPGATEELPSNPNNLGFIEVPGVGSVYVGALSNSDPYALSAQIRGGITVTLRLKGYTQAQIDEYFKTGKVPTRPGNKSITGSGKSDSTPALSFVDYGEATVSVKTSNGYSAIPQRVKENKPYIFQRYTDGKGDLYERKFVFPYVPQTISYTPGGSEWNEVPRSTDSPLVEWNSWSLTKVQMSFIVAGKRNETNGKTNTEVPDGINEDVEDELQMLRAMATLPFPVTIFGLDDIFDLQLRQAAITGIPTEWAITDLSITAKRRTTFSPSLISVAQVSLSLTEYPIEKQNIYRLPKLKIPGTPPPPPNPGGGNPSGPNLWTPILQPSVRDSIVLPTATV